MSYDTNMIRNVAVCGHGNTGKTTLVEQILFKAGVITRAESVESGKTVSDYTEEEIERGTSIHTTLSFIDWNGTKINLFDTPGVSDYVGEVVAAFRSAESAVMLIDAHSGVQIETVKLWRRLNARDMPRIAFINKMDNPAAKFFDSLKALEDFKLSPIPVTLPIGEGDSFEGVINLLRMKAYLLKDGKEVETDIPDAYREQAEEYHLKLIEMAAEGDDSLTEKYFSEGDLGIEDAIEGLREGLFADRFVPVFCGSALKNIGLTPLLNFIANDSPAPGRVEEPCATGETSVKMSSGGNFSGMVFKTTNDKYSGKLSAVKVITGKLTAGSEVISPKDGKKIKVGKVFVAEGKKLTETNEVIAGDIAVLAKLEGIGTNDTLCTPDNIIHFRALALPHPVYSLAVEAEEQKNEDKLNEHFHRFAEEDLTFKVIFNEETRESVISGMGELHINTILEKILKNYKISVRTRTPKVPYRETIGKEAEAEYTHKKQSGGHGQYGRVNIRIKPLTRGEQFSFSNDIKGGAVGKGYMPGIEKGLLEGMNEGYLAGYPLVDIGVSIFDGKEHPVDSSEMSFKIAAKHALKEAVAKADPLILEPIVNLTVFVEEGYMGDVLSDLSGRRGRVLDQAPLGGNIVSIKALVPEGELLRYAIDLRSMTSGTGAFEVEFSHYDPVSGKVREEIIKESQK